MKKKENKIYQFAGYHFLPDGKLEMEGRTLSDLIFKNHTDLRLWDEGFAKCYGIEPVMKYDMNLFYTVMENSDADIFLCLEDGKRYVPCEHELMEFRGYRDVIAAQWKEQTAQLYEDYRRTKEAGSAWYGRAYVIEEMYDLYEKTGKLGKAMLEVGELQENRSMILNVSDLLDIDFKELLEKIQAGKKLDEQETLIVCGAVDEMFSKKLEDAMDILSELYKDKTGIDLWKTDSE